MASAERKPVTIPSLRKRIAAGGRFSVLTCYDATTARWLNRAGIDALLVGDTAAEMILGLPSTIHAPLDFLVQITAAVKRGAPECFVIADMPFMSYHASPDDAVRNAGRFLTEGLADAVKLEVDESFAPLVERMSRAGIPIIAHLGSRPQQVRRTGGYHSAGRTRREANEIVEQAKLFADRGAIMLLLEAVPNEVSQRVVKCVSIPVIGCGAGAACHGHVVVLQDLLGMTDWQPPFAHPLADIGAKIQTAAEQWAAKIADGFYLRNDHPYKMLEE